jgi:hypothetical protein
LFDALPAEPALKLHTRLLPIARNKGNVRFPPKADIPDCFFATLKPTP